MGEQKRGGGAFKVMIWCKQATNAEAVFIGSVGPYRHHEEGSHYVRLLFWNFFVL